MSADRGSPAKLTDAESHHVQSPWLVGRRQHLPGVREQSEGVLRPLHRFLQRSVFLDILSDRPRRRSGAVAGLPAGLHTGLLEIGQAAAGAQGVVAFFTHVAEGRPMAALRDGRKRNNEGGKGAHGFLLDARSHDRFNSITFY